MFPHVHAALGVAAELVFDRGRPWGWVLRGAIADRSFWHTEIEEPAMLVLANAARLSQMVDGDAPVAGASGVTVATTLSAPRAAPHRPAPPASKTVCGVSVHMVGDGWDDAREPPRDQALRLVSIRCVPGDRPPGSLQQRHCARAPVREVPLSSPRGRQVLVRCGARAAPRPHGQRQRQRARPIFSLTRHSAGNRFVGARPRQLRGVFVP